MKTLKILFSVCLFSIFAVSCSDDENNSTKVKYEIVGLDNTVTQIKYTKGNGSKTVSVTTYPFTANLEVTVNNVTSASKTYTLVIYVDGESVDFTPFVVPANTTVTSDVDFLIESD